MRPAWIPPEVGPIGVWRIHEAGAITWHRTRLVDTPDAYWSYLRRYPRGPHAADARRRLAILAAALEPPPSFPMIDYDVPPPVPDEIVYVDRPVLVFDDP